MSLFRLFLLLIGLFILTGCINSEEKLPEITIQTASPEPTPTSPSDKPDPHWPDQELLLHCTIEWKGEKRGLFTRYDPVNNYWHSKKILSYFSHFSKDNILPDDRHWIIAKIDGFDENQWASYSYTLNYELEKTPIETEIPIHLIFARIHASPDQPDLYLMEQLCTECPSHYSWIDVEKCRAGNCNFQSLELGYPSSKTMWQNYWSPDFKYLFMYDSQDSPSRLILTDHNERILYDFDNRIFAPFWFDSTTFGVWSRPVEQEDSILYYGSVSDGEIHSLFTKSEILSLLPRPPAYLASKIYPTANAKGGENQFIVSFTARYYGEPEPNNEYNLMVRYNESTDEFDILWESFGRRGLYLSPDRIKIYISTDYYSPWETYSGDWQVIDLISGEISVTNWLPLNPSRYSDLSYDTEWRVNFEPVIQEPDQIIIASSQPGSRQILFTNKDGFEKVVEYPENISDCSGGWVFK